MGRTLIGTIGLQDKGRLDRLQDLCCEDDHFRFESLGFF